MGRMSNRTQLDYIEKLFDEKLNVIDERLKNVDKKNDFRFKNLSNEIRELKEAILGNGKIGLTERVEKNTRDLAMLKTKITTYVAIAGSVLALVFEVGKEFIKNYFK